MAISPQGSSSIPRLVSSVSLFSGGGGGGAISGVVIMCFYMASALRCLIALSAFYFQIE